MVVKMVCAVSKQDCDRTEKSYSRRLFVDKLTRDVFGFFVYHGYTDIAKQTYEIHKSPHPQVSPIFKIEGKFERSAKKSRDL